MVGSDIALSEAVIERLDNRPPRYCNTVLRYLRDRSPEAVPVEELAPAVRRADQQAVAERRIAVRLHHSTLPKLADSGLIEYDAESNTARWPDAESRLPGEQ